MNRKLKAIVERLGIRDAIASSLFGLGLSHPGRVFGGGMCSVSLHRVLKPEQLAGYPIPEIAMTPSELGWFLDYFRRYFTMTTVAEGTRALERGAVPAERPLLAVTFDDGQLDNFTNAAPVLAEHGVRATFCVPTAAVQDGQPLWHDRLGYAALAFLTECPNETSPYVSRLGVRAGRERSPSAWVEAAKELPLARRLELAAELESRVGGPRTPAWDGFMTFEQLRTLAGQGHEIASHSVSHDLLPQMDDDAVLREARESKRILEAEVGVEISTFCYPNGSSDERVARLVEQAGYQRAITTAWGKFGKEMHRFSLPRIDMEPEFSKNRAGALSAAQVAYRMSPFHPRFRAAPR